MQMIGIKKKIWLMKFWRNSSCWIGLESVSSDSGAPPKENTLRQEAYLCGQIDMPTAERLWHRCAMALNRVQRASAIRNG